MQLFFVQLIDNLIVFQATCTVVHSESAFKNQADIF